MCATANLFIVELTYELTISERTAAVVGALPCNTCPIRPHVFAVQRTIQHQAVVLTVVAQTVRSFGTIAMEFLLERLQGEAEPQPRKVVLTPELIVRRSCGS